MESLLLEVPATSRGITETSSVVMESLLEFPAFSKGTTAETSSVESLLEVPALGPVDRLTGGGLDVFKPV